MIYLVDFECFQFDICRIIVCTFVAARQFLKAKLPRRIQFHDLFMDEVGHASELTALCSIEGLFAQSNFC